MALVAGVRTSLVLAVCSSSSGFADLFFVFRPSQSWTHNIAREKEFLRKLVKANVIADLTNGI